MAAEDVNYEHRLHHLTAEMENVRDLLSQKMRSSVPDSGDDGISVTIASIKSLQESEAARIMSLTLDTSEIAGKMSHTIRIRDLQMVWIVFSLGTGLAD